MAKAATLTELQDPHRLIATSVVFIKNNGGYGVFARQGGTVDMTGVSELSKAVGNASGTCSPAKDTGTGIVQSFIHLSA